MVRFALKIKKNARLCRRTSWWLRPAPSAPEENPAERERRSGRVWTKFVCLVCAVRLGWRDDGVADVQVGPTPSATKSAPTAAGATTTRSASVPRATWASTAAPRCATRSAWTAAAARRPACAAVLPGSRVATAKEVGFALFSRIFSRFPLPSFILVWPNYSHDTVPPWISLISLAQRVRFFKDESWTKRKSLVALDLNWLLVRWLYWWHQRDDSFTYHKTCEIDWSQLNAKTKRRCLLSSLLSHQKSPWFNIIFA